MQNEEFWKDMKEQLHLCCSPEETKEFVDGVLKLIKVFDTPFVCLKCKIEKSLLCQKKKSS